MLHPGSCGRYTLVFGLIFRYENMADNSAHDNQLESMTDKDKNEDTVDTMGISDKNKV